MSALLALACVGLLAYANGANDNYKGVATLFGGGVSDYRRALWWATATTLAGSLAAVGLTAQLVEAFNGKLFVSPEVLALPGFALAVCGASALTVWLATRFGLPISTTHALAGSLLGAAAAAAGPVNWAAAGWQIFLPLALAPAVALAAAVLLYPLLHRLRLALSVSRETCVCVGETLVPVNSTAALRVVMSTGEAPVCRERYSGAVMGVEAGRTLDALHYASAGLVSFARGVNDTPKIVALVLLAAPLLAADAAGGAPTFAVVGLAIALGGLLGARRVAETLSHRITEMNPGQGLTANLITSSLVLTASPLGLPLSTTHVSCGALFGIGAATRQAHWPVIRSILGAWLVTLPMAATLGAALMIAGRTLN